MSRDKTLLALGAHADDCPFGLAGTMVKAVRKGYRVVILNLIGIYRGRCPTDPQNEAFTAQAAEINTRYGAETKFLQFASGQLDLGMETKQAVAEVVVELQPDIAFHLWPDDHHPDHVAAAAICRSAIYLGGRLVGRAGFRGVQQVYAYDNGPRHTIGFTPDTFVDVTEEWPDAIQWVGEVGALYRDAAYDPAQLEPNQRSKEILSAYRGETCGVRYAEAFWSAHPSPAEIL